MDRSRHAPSALRRAHGVSFGQHCVFGRTSTRLLLARCCGTLRLVTRLLYKTITYLPSHPPPAAGGDYNVGRCKYWYF
jgi:hypothetical protein